MPPFVSTVALLGWDCIRYCPPINPVGRIAFCMVFLSRECLLVLDLKIGLSHSLKTLALVTPKAGNWKGSGITLLYQRGVASICMYSHVTIISQQWTELVAVWCCPFFHFFTSIAEVGMVLLVTWITGFVHHIQVQINQLLTFRRTHFAALRIGVNGPLRISSWIATVVASVEISDDGQLFPVDKNVYSILGVL